MRVGIIGTAHPYRGGGTSTYNERLAREFQSMGHEVIIYNFTLQYPTIFFPGTSQYTDEPSPRGLNIVRCVNSVNPLNWFKVGRRIRKEQLDLIVIRFWIPFMGPSLGTIARFVRKNKHTYIAAIADNIIPHEKKVMDRKLTSYFVKSVDGFVTMSRSVLKDLEQFDKRKPKVYVPHPLYDNYGEPVDKGTACKNLDLDPNQNYLLFFGFIREYKGLDLLLKAIAVPECRKLDFKLLIAGEYYANEEQYRSIIEEYGIEDKLVLHTHFVKNSDIVNYFSLADMVVQPYKTATQSGVTQVAFHFDLPMLTTNVGGLAELVPDGEAGFVVEPDVSQIANAIKKYYQTEDKEKFPNFISEYKKMYSWKRMVENLIGLKTK